MSLTSFSVATTWHSINSGLSEIMHAEKRKKRCVTEADIKSRLFLRTKEVSAPPTMPKPRPAASFLRSTLPRMSSLALANSGLDDLVSAAATWAADPSASGRREATGAPGAVHKRLCLKTTRQNSQPPGHHNFSEHVLHVVHLCIIQQTTLG
jgi:hypothetical protein